MGGGLSAGIEHFAAQYAIYALLVKNEALPGGEAAAWLTSWMWTFSVGLFVFLCLLFPNGRLPGRRWLGVAWLGGIVLLAGAVLTAFQPGPIDGLGSIRNPLGREGAVLVQKGNDFLVQALLGGLGLVATASLFVRLHSATDVEERQQIKVFIYAATVLASGVVLAYTVYAMTRIPWILGIGLALVMAGATGIPIAVGIAVKRYHLYHIDLIIKHTLVYVSLTLILAALFELFIILLSSFYSELTHLEPQTDESRRLAEGPSAERLVGRLGEAFSAQLNHLKEPKRLAEIFAALSIAALFDPLRERIQRFVDRLVSSGGDESRPPPRSE